MAFDKFSELNSFSIIVANNNRAKAYLQGMSFQGFLPDRAFFLNTGAEKLPEHVSNDFVSEDNNQKHICRLDQAGIEFDEKQHVLTTLKSNKIPIETFNTKEVNSEQLIQAIAKHSPDYLVYAGPGGTILRKNFLAVAKTVLHVHPGWLPVYRGSTTIYYTLLNNEKPACSVIAMGEKVDAGPTFLRRRFEFDSSVDADYHFDPLMRTATLLEFFRNNWGKTPSPISINEDEANEYYVIHPLLKHLSLYRPEND